MDIEINSAALNQSITGWEKIRRLITPRPGEEYLNSWQRRVVDIIGGAILLPLVAPPIILSALAMRLEGQGKFFYVQERIGKSGRSFGMYKLRTMKEVLRDQDRAFTFPNLPKDERVTRVGGFLRRWTLNELPQVINVFKGDMSLLGIRALPPGQYDLYQRLPLNQDLRSQWVEAYCLTRPGWTSLTSVRGRALLDQNERGVRRRMKYEIFYSRHASLGLDLLILKEGIGAFISGKGAQ